MNHRVVLKVTLGVGSTIYNNINTYCNQTNSVDSMLRKNGAKYLLYRNRTKMKSLNLHLRI